MEYKEGTTFIEPVKPGDFCKEAQTGVGQSEGPSRIGSICRPARMGVLGKWAMRWLIEYNRFIIRSIMYILCQMVYIVQTIGLNHRYN